MSTARKKYDEEFKRKAVERLRAGAEAAALAKELKVAQSMLYQWRKKSAAGIEVRPASRSKEAIIYLRHARDALKDELSQGKLKHPLRSHLLMELALFELTGE